MTQRLHSADTLVRGMTQVEYSNSNGATADRKRELQEKIFAFWVH